MAGEFDVYQTCPCGSGKKLKFCCHAIVGEMAKIGDMQRHHQDQMALGALDALEKSNLKEVWSRAWVRTTKATVLMALRRHDEANRLVAQVTEELPEHPRANALHAILELSKEGYPASRRAIYAALKANRDDPSL